jgi:two-component system, sensor histidine kinase and response regulator
MLSYQSLILRRILPVATFNRLRLALGQMAQRVGANPLILTETALSSVEIRQGMLAEKFTVLVSPQFSALLLGEASESESLDWQDPATRRYQVGLTFEPKAIAAFLNQLSSLLNNSAVALATLQQASLTLQPNDTCLQSEFTLSLLEILSLDGQEYVPPETEYPYVSVCQPVHEALRHQVEQEGLLNQVTAQIRQSLELPVILDTVVEQVRSFLQAERLVIYQFEQQRIGGASEQASRGYEEMSNFAPSPIPDAPFSAQKGWGRITYEARAADAIPSVLNLGEDKRCFVDVPNRREKYRKGFTLAVEDTETAYALSPCMLEFMRRMQVRAKLVVPIVVQDELWGLLIAHQCFEPRQWQDNEKTFLQHIAEHLAIAIYQTQLYTELQQQKQTLEKRVIERTQELHEALLAAQSANRAKTEFLATMSHELRTPLTCVIGLSATLLRWSFGHLTQRQRDYIQTIHDNGEHLLELINDILDLSQVEAGKTVLNICEFSLTQLAHQTLQTVKEKAIQRGVQLSMDLQVIPGRDRFRADPKRLQQILLNLLTNAIKFTPEGGKVILRIWIEGNTAVFQVEDTGIGIPEHQQHLLFEKFQQLDTSYRREYEGIGLGLALTKQLVELHRGGIEVESTVGVGSIFTVWLPCQAVTSATSGPVIPAIADTPSGQIALIADQEETAILICNILTAAGYQVVWLMEGSAAVKQIEILQPLLAIVDINLMGMNGAELIGKLRKTSPTQHLKCLALIAQETPDTLTHILAAGANDYLTQPIQPEQLLLKITALLVAKIPSACAIK